MQSLKERIKRAKTEAEIDALLMEGKMYEFAKPKTQRAWVKMAEARKVKISKNKTESGQNLSTNNADSADGGEKKKTSNKVKNERRKNR